MDASLANRPRRRLRREDWIDAALDAIVRGGLGAVRVEPLAARLGVTKGSFYSHFSSRDELIEAALASWESSRGDAGLERFAEIEDPAERLRQMLGAALTFTESGAGSVHVSLLGELGDPRVRAAVGRVTEARLGLLRHSYRQLGYSPRRADHRARLAYAAYRGLLQMAREGPERRVAGGDVGRFIAEVNSALVAPPRDAAEEMPS
jgi:AcrR family transcriptional regulator